MSFFSQSLIFTISFFAFAGFSHGSSLGRYGVKASYDDKIDYEKLKDLIESKKIKTLEEALAVVPKDFYNNYVLVYRSRSLQDSSYLFPRAIVFGRSAKFIMAFNGHKKQRGYNNLEIIQFREASKRWEFREVSFKKGKAPHFSGPNPKACLECHQSPRRTNVDPRPNWEPYNFWPGVYGSVDEKIVPILSEELREYRKTGSMGGRFIKRFEKQDYILVGEQAQEEEMLKTFRSKIKPKHSRYKVLGEFHLRHPLSMTKMLIIHNMKRVVRIMREELKELVDVYKYALFGLGNASDQSSKNLIFKCYQLYMPELVLNKHQRRARKSRNYVEILDHVKNSYGEGKKSIGTSIEIIFAPLGVMTEDWSMDFRTKGRFSFRDRFTSPAAANTHFRDALVASFEGDKVTHMNCDELKHQSEAALNEFNESGALDTVLTSAEELTALQTSKPLINRCISCHVYNENGDTAPYIPFHDFKALRSQWALKKYKRGNLMDEIRYRTGDHAPLRDQMPPAGVIDSNSRKELIESLEKIMPSN